MNSFLLRYKLVVTTTPLSKPLAETFLLMLVDVLKLCGISRQYLQRGVFRKSLLDHHWKKEHTYEISGAPMRNWVQFCAILRNLLQMRLPLESLSCTLPWQNLVGLREHHRRNPTNSDTLQRTIHPLIVSPRRHCTTGHKALVSSFYGCDWMLSSGPPARRSFSRPTSSKSSFCGPRSCFQ
jgi:hypothetical protein